MSFLYPAFLIGALAAAIPIVLHLLRRDVAPEVPFSAVRLIRRSPVERSKRRRLRDVLLLAARVAAVVLLAAAFARPYAPSAAPTALRVVAIDRSFSMTAPGRVERAAELARAVIDEAAIGERVALIAFDDRAVVLSEPGTAADARGALPGVAAGFGATRYGPVIEKAQELADGAPVRLVFVTDLQRSGWDGGPAIAVPAGWQIEVRDTGEVAGNLAVTGVRRDPDRVVLSIRNAGSAQQQGEARVEVDGKRAASGRFRVEAGGTMDVPINMRAPAKGVLVAAIDDPEGFAADDARYVALDAASRSGVAIVSGGNQRQSGFYLARALGTDEGGIESTPIDVAALSSMPLDRLSAYSAVALLSTRGLERKGRDLLGAYVRSGGGLLVAAAPDVEAALVSSALGWQPPLAPIELADRPLAFAATDPRHPIFRPFGALAANLGQVRFDKVWRVRPDGWEVVARFSDGTPALLERTEGSGRVVLFASDLDRRWNDFPLHPSFVPFAIESLAYVSRARQASRDYTIGTAPEGASPRPGVYNLPGGAVAVNVDTRESATARLTAREFQEMFVQGAAAPPASALQSRQTEARQSFWRYGLMLMLAVLVAESVVGRR